MENCKEGELLKIMFPISGVVIFYLGQAVASLYCLHISSIKIWKCCHSDMMAKGGNVSRVEGSGSEGRQVQHETGTVNKTIV